MSYKDRAKYKNVKRYIYKFQEALKFKTGHVSNAGKMVLFGIAVVICSLVFYWVDSTTGTISGGAFSRISGKPAIMICVILCMIIFSIFSIQKKSKLQLISNWYFKDYTSCILGGLLIIILCINTLTYIGGLQMFESDVIAGRGPIFCLCGGIIIMMGGFFMKFEVSKNIRGTFINEPETGGELKEEREKNNMKLPF